MSDIKRYVVFNQRTLLFTCFYKLHEVQAEILKRVHHGEDTEDLHIFDNEESRRVLFDVNIGESIGITFDEGDRVIHKGGWV